MEIFPTTEGGPYQLFPTAMGLGTYVLFPATLLNFVKAQKSPPISLSHAAASRAKWLILLRDASGTQNRPGR